MSKEHTKKPETPDLVGQNLEAVMALYAAEAAALPKHQRAIERVVHALASPACLLGILVAIGLWIAMNLTMRHWGIAPWDRPPFAWLQTTITVIALVISSLIIITQRRQGKIAERNAHLDLQVNLLVEQKVTMVIQLLEEMRRDSPMLRNRADGETNELLETLDAVHVATVIAERMAEEPPQET